MLEPHHFEPGEPYHLAAPGSFVQAHPAQAARLYAAVETALLARLGAGFSGARVLELFAGSGALALRLAKRGARVTAVDSHEPGVRALAEAARAQGIALETRAAPAEAALSDVPAPDAIVVDPPRRGLSPELRRAVAEQGRPKLLAYVSCEPATLARDLAHFAALGYGATTITPFDLMPLAESVEVLCVLHAGDTFESGVRFFAKSPRAEAAASRELAFARAEHSVLVRGITRKKGHLGAFSYRRVKVVGTHSLLTVEGALSPPAAWLRALDRIGHPALGDARHGDPKSNRHFAERHGLDRPFLHLGRVTLAERTLTSALAPDLEAVLASLSGS
jgi:23S rRNA (uracil1939-C5)-methyltransferase